jgi:hypothetical protein
MAPPLRVFQTPMQGSASAPTNTPPRVAIAIGAE